MAKNKKPSPPPQKDAIDNIFDFFFGTSKKVGRTLVGIAVLVVFIFPEKIIAILEGALYTIVSGILTIGGNILPGLIIIAIFYFFLKKLFGK